MKSLRPPLLSVDSDIDEILWPNRYLLTSVGLWPLDSDANSSTKIFALIRVITVIVVLTFVTAPQFIIVYTHWGDVDVLTENGIVMLGYSLLLVKIFFVIIRREDFYVTYDWMRHFWRMVKTQEERNKVVSIANHARFCTLLYSYVGFFDVMAFTCGSYMITLYNQAHANGSDYVHRLPFGIWYGMETQSSPGYEIIFAIQTLSLIVACPTIIGLDISTMLILMHVASQFKLVSMRLRCIGQKISKIDKRASKSFRPLTAEIKSCIIHQQKVLSAFRFVEKLLGPLNFFQFILSAIEICFVGWAIVEADSNMAYKAKFLLVLIIFALQLMSGCWSGEIIIRESTEIARVVSRDIPWFVLPTSLQQDLKFMICNSQKQCEVTAIGLQVMSLKKMSEVFNTSLSYLALLRNMAN